MYKYQSLKNNLDKSNRRDDFNDINGYEIMF